MKRYVCIHGHFYQPPRENAWLEAIELQESARPYHDWNERIDAECYSQNGASRILDAEGRVTQIVNNYARLSFNFGPTLLAWMQAHAPQSYAAVLQADQDSIRRFGGHGSAMAQAYNHMILPLANERDRRTQVHWGIRDFEHRFKRKPEGMWLPETGADDATLETLAAAGITFTILSPYQCKRMRKLGSDDWQDVDGGRIDPTRAYLRRLPSGRQLVLFFYDGPISRAIAFEGLLHKGEHLAGRLMHGFDDARDWPQLVHVATDGESYGHHHRSGDMALAYALHHIEERGLAKLINYGQYLELHPPQYEVEIHDKTAWSCAHGLGRWERDCGCHTGARAGWSQQWRAPLRAALDELRDRIAPVYEREAGKLFREPWQARDEYIDVILDRSHGNVSQVLARQMPPAQVADPGARTRALELLELQRHAQLMYTSCGWFFDEISGIETVQVMQYAARAMQLAAGFGADDLEAPFLHKLTDARSNVRSLGDGRRIFERMVRPMAVDLLRVGAHYAVGSLFDEQAEETAVYCYDVRRIRHEVRRSGANRFVAGRAVVTSHVTGGSTPFVYAGIYFGDHNVTVGVRGAAEPHGDDSSMQEIHEAFERADMPQLIRVLDRHFPQGTASLRSLFRDEQHRIVQRLMEPSVVAANETYRQIYAHNAGLMRLLADGRIHVPRPLEIAAELALNHELEIALGEEPLLPQKAEALLAEAVAANLDLDEALLGYVFRSHLERLAHRLQADPADESLLDELEGAAWIAERLPFDADATALQNVLYSLLQQPAHRRARLLAVATRFGLRVEG